MGVKGFQVNVRVIAATHRNLGLMVREGRFREDLLFRLNVVRLLLDFTYPGNVRELRNIVEYAVNICEEESDTA